MVNMSMTNSRCNKKYKFISLFSINYFNICGIRNHKNYNEKYYMGENYSSKIYIKVNDSN